MLIDNLKSYIYFDQECGIQIKNNLEDICIHSPYKGIL
jgi:hypothetical protein